MYSKPCSNSSNIEYSYLNMFSNLMFTYTFQSKSVPFFFFTKMFCLKHQHFIIYSIQIFIFFFIHVLFLNSSLTNVVPNLNFSDICSKLFHYCYSIQNIRELKTVNLLLYERNLNMYKYFIHIGVDPLDLILQQIIDSDV